jgi:hypothetical protein
MEAEATGMRARIVGASMRFQNSPARNSAPAHYALSSSPKMALAQPPGFAFTSTASPPMPPKQEKAQRLMKKMSKTPPDTYCGRSSEAAIPPEFGTMPQMNNPSGAAFHGQQQILAQLQAKLAAQRVARPQIQQHAQLLQNSSPGSAQRTGGAGGSLFGGAVSFGQQLSSGLFGSASKPQVGGLFSSSNSAAKHFSQTLQSHETYVSGSIVGNLFGGSMASQNGPATTAGTPSDSFQSIECHAPAPPPPAQSHPFEYKQTYQATFGSCQPLMSQHVHPRKLRSNVVDMSATPIQVDWTSESESEKVLALIALQDFEGSWPYDKEVGQIMGFEIPQRPKGGEQKVWVTLLVVCFLEQKMSGEEGTWGLVVEKARGWLEGSGDMDLEDLEENAKAFVIKN